MRPGAAAIFQQKLKERTSRVILSFRPVKIGFKANPHSFDVKVAALFWAAIAFEGDDCRHSLTVLAPLSSTYPPYPLPRGE